MASAGLRRPGELLPVLQRQQSMQTANRTTQRLGASPRAEPPARRHRNRTTQPSTPSRSTAQCMPCSDGAWRRPSAATRSWKGASEGWWEHCGETSAGQRSQGVPPSPLSTTCRVFCLALPPLPAHRYAGIIDLTRRLNSMHATPRGTQLATVGILRSLFPAWLPPAFALLFSRPMPTLSCQVRQGWCCGGRVDAGHQSR